MSLVKKEIRAALRNKALTDAVLKNTRLSISKRDEIVKDFDDLDALRDMVREVRQRSIDNSGDLIARYAEKFTAAGGKLHVCDTADNACNIVVGILRDHNAQQGVKSKSMVAEEIGLGRALENAGIDAVESDLGEYIVQLAGESPSHITAPALHHSRQSIGRLFAEKLKIPYTDDPVELTMIARQRLRERFLHAEFGISGSNFLVAESGSLALVENEGNIRLGLSLPPLYIAVTGIEKVIENTADLVPILELLSKSATGQRFTSYMHQLRPTCDGEDGPREMHLILVDNGRSSAMTDPQMREMMMCIRCGACLNICPVYRSTGGHAYRSIYPGPMGAVMSNLLGRKTMLHPELPHMSTLCGACRDICPVKIDIPRMLLELRARDRKPVYQQLAACGWNWVMQTRQRYELAGRSIHRTAGLLPGENIRNWLEEGKVTFREGLRRRIK